MIMTEFEDRIAHTSAELDQCREEIGKRIVGQQNMVDGILMALIAGGHVLL